MPGQLLRLSDRLLMPPLIHPAKAQIILGVLNGRIGLEASLFGVEEDRSSPDASRFVGSTRRGDGSASLTRTADGVAIVPVLDTLVNRGAWLDSRSGLTSYEGSQPSCAMQGKTRRYGRSCSTYPRPVAKPPAWQVWRI